MQNLFKFGFCLNLLLLGCDADKETDDVVCEDSVLIDKNIFQAIKGDEPHITSIELINDCLLVNITDSGCTGDLWILKLIDSDTVYRRNVPLRELKFIYDNHEECDALVTKEFSFDLKNLRIGGDSKIEIDLIGYDYQIVYEY